MPQPENLRPAADLTLRPIPLWGALRPAADLALERFHFRKALRPAADLTLRQLPFWGAYEGLGHKPKRPNGGDRELGHTLSYMLHTVLHGNLMIYM